MGIWRNQGFRGLFKWLAILNSLSFLHHMVYFSMISNGKKENKVMLIIFQVVNSQSQIILNNRYKFYKQPELEEETRFAYFPASTMVILDTESEFPNFLF